MGYTELVWGNPVGHHSRIERTFQTGEMKEFTKSSLLLLQVTLQGVNLLVPSEVITLAKEAKAKGVSNQPAVSVVQAVVAGTHFSPAVPGFLKRDKCNLGEREKGRQEYQRAMKEHIFLSLVSDFSRSSIKDV